MASFKAKFPVLQELFAKNHRGGPLGPPAGRGLRLGLLSRILMDSSILLHRPNVTNIN